MCEALDIYKRTRGLYGILALAAASLLYVKQNRIERGIELYALVEDHRFVANSHWFEAVWGQPVAAVAATLSSEQAQRARDRGRELAMMETLAKLHRELCEYRQNK